MSEKIRLIEQRETLDTDGNIDDEIVNDDVKIAQILNRFFSNAVKDLKIPGFHGVVPLAHNISHPIFRAILKYANHPSTIAIKNLKNTSMFSFSNVSVPDVKNEIRKLDRRKTTQNTNIPVRILKQSSNIFDNYICGFFNECIDKVLSPSILKMLILHLFLKKILEDQKIIIDWGVHFQLYLKYLRNYYQNKHGQTIWTNFSLNINVSLEKDLMCSIAF